MDDSSRPTSPSEATSLPQDTSQPNNFQAAPMTYPSQSFYPPQTTSGDTTTVPSHTPFQQALSFLHDISRYRNHLLDRLAPHILYRWLGFTGILCLFLLRMFILEGFYLWTYCLCIFLLNQFVLFLQPKDRATLVAAAVSREQGLEDSESGPALPTADSDEFRPFVRRLPEFRFWYSSTIASIICFFITFFPILDVPVYWPVLVMYFVMLVVATFRKQWLDMKRLKYVPWDLGKKKYTSDPKSFVVKRNNVATAAQALVQKQTTAITGTQQQPSNPVPTVNLARKTNAKKAAQD